MEHNQQTDFLMAVGESQPDDLLDQIRYPRLDKIEELTMQILHELCGDGLNDDRCFRMELITANCSLKEAIEGYQGELADVQICRLEEKIFALRKEVSCLKTQLNKLNALITSVFV
ncbi:hypothetical protein GOP47_0030897 [Adiantum capillus-veneris]|nr:hypothetical protein GOP47_0030897 [Adiantum capillus-veneris]